MSNLEKAQDRAAQMHQQFSGTNLTEVAIEVGRDTFTFTFEATGPVCKRHQRWEGEGNQWFGLE